MEEKLQKLYVEFQMLSQHIKQLEEKTAALNNQLMDLAVTNQSLEEMKKLKQGTEILVPLSNGIYTKAEIKDNKNVIVNVGSNVTTVKDIDSTKKLIEAQIEDVKNLHERLVNELQNNTSKAVILEEQINNIASTLKK